MENLKHRQFFEVESKNEMNHQNINAKIIEKPVNYEMKKALR